jgi:hypothetical protein
MIAETFREFPDQRHDQLKSINGKGLRKQIPVLIRQSNITATRTKIL